MYCGVCADAYFILGRSEDPAPLSLDFYFLFFTCTVILLYSILSIIHFPSYVHLLLRPSRALVPEHNANIFYLFFRFLHFAAEFVRVGRLLRLVIFIIVPSWWSFFPRIYESYFDIHFSLLFCLHPSCGVDRHRGDEMKIINWSISISSYCDLLYGHWFKHSRTVRIPSIFSSLLPHSILLFYHFISLLNCFIHVHIHLVYLYLICLLLFLLHPLCFLLTLSYCIYA
jgi:hypothetical protein